MAQITKQTRKKIEWYIYPSCGERISFMCWEMDDVVSDKKTYKRQQDFAEQKLVNQNQREKKAMERDF